LFVLIGALVAIVAAAVIGTVLFVDNTLPPLDSANDFLNDLADARFQSAVDRLCVADRATPQDALTSVTRHFPGHNRVSVNPLDVDRDGDYATVGYTVSARASGPSDSYELPMVYEGGEWRPCPSATGPGGGNGGPLR
jgi:hypothetical protein